ncbi:sufE-like protein 2, chloroplastic [Benincasa hispida]|uniref:sufE-like protein 2, chloroplastic n=1 Tax=Benincasa hispida TaxID=102211 RepID=UPI0019000288|nr:sufE-like protein 2, chloroplastic [Benincasa hispida]
MATFVFNPLLFSKFCEFFAPPSISFHPNMSSIPMITSSGIGFAKFSGSSNLCLQQIPSPHMLNRRFVASKSVTCTISHDLNLTSSNKLCTRRPNCDLDSIAIPLYTSELVADRLHRLVLEFESLLEPIDRVKRLLHYAAILDPSDESIRLPENRVRGCATQVWLDVKIDEFDRMRFKADSDSEIAKGYCSCLIWMLEGAEPWEVLKVRSDDLEAVNVGLHGKAASRVNTWQNVLMSMQMRTKTLVSKIEAKPPLEPFTFRTVHHRLHG